MLLAKMYDEESELTEEMYQYIQSRLRPRLIPINNPIVVIHTPIKNNWIKEFFLKRGK